MEATSFEDAGRLRHFDEWHDDDGPVLWWTWPVCEPPYSGTPLDTDFPGRLKFWTPLVLPPEGQSPPMSRISQAAHQLWEHFFRNCPGVHTYVQSIGVAENTGTIWVYLVREPMAHERPIPAEVDGWKVETRVIGQVTVGQPVDD